MADGLIYLTGPSAGLAGLYVNSRSGRSVHLVATSDDGRNFRPLGPDVSNSTVPESVSFAGREDGWLTSFNLATNAETLYRTRNGGRSWRAFTEGTHSLAAGSTDTVQFTSPSAGWLTAIEPTEPGEVLYRTTDGGTRWRCVAALRSASSRRCPAVLPELGRITFASGVTTGWLGGGPFSSALYRTRNGGRSWQRMAIPARAGAVFGLPAVLGRTIIETEVFPSGKSFSMRNPRQRGQRRTLADGVRSGPGCDRQQLLRPHVG